MGMVPGLWGQSGSMGSVVLALWGRSMDPVLWLWGQCGAGPWGLVTSPRGSEQCWVW